VAGGRGGGDAEASQETRVVTSSDGREASKPHSLLVLLCAHLYMLAGECVIFGGVEEGVKVLLEGEELIGEL